MSKRRQRPVGKKIRHADEVRRERIVWTKRIVYPLCVLLVMGLIFFFSAQPAPRSQDLSDGLLERILGLFGEILPPAVTLFLDEYIRKVAHFVIYFLLGVFAALSARVWIYVEAPVQPEYAGIWELAAYRRNFRMSYFWLPLVIGVLYAISDEVHQLYVYGRSGEVRDVLLDACGVAVGIIIVIFACRRKSTD